MNLVSNEGDYDRLVAMMRDHTSGTRYVGLR
jgi:hypothetical protein